MGNAPSVTACCSNDYCDESWSENMPNPDMNDAARLAVELRATYGTAASPPLKIAASPLRATAGADATAAANMAIGLRATYGKAETPLKSASPVTRAAASPAEVGPGVAAAAAMATGLRQVFGTQQYKPRTGSPLEGPESKPARMDIRENHFAPAASPATLDHTLIAPPPTRLPWRPAAGSRPATSPRIGSAAVTQLLMGSPASSLFDGSPAPPPLLPTSCPQPTCPLRCDIRGGS